MKLKYFSDIPFVNLNEIGIILTIIDFQNSEKMYLFYIENIILKKQLISTVNVVIEIYTLCCWNLFLLFFN